MAIKIERIEKDTGKKFITYSTPNKVSKKILSGWIDININRIKEDLISFKFAFVYCNVIMM